MVHKPFAFATLMAAFSLLASQPKPAQAESAGSYVYDCSWATAVDGTPLLFNVRGQNVAGVADGCFGVSGNQWTTMGCFASESDYKDSAGNHVDVVANLMFSHTANNIKTDHIRAKADFKGLIKADGSQYEGVEITDLSGKVLYSTGRDAQGQIVMVKLTRGSLNIGPVAVASQAAK